jgi:hypothetical protein
MAPGIDQAHFVAGQLFRSAQTHRIEEQKQIFPEIVKILNRLEQLAVKQNTKNTVVIRRTGLALEKNSVDEYVVEYGKISVNIQTALSALSRTEADTSLKKKKIRESFKTFSDLGLETLAITCPGAAVEERKRLMMSLDILSQYRNAVKNKKTSSNRKTALQKGLPPFAMNGVSGP